ncbi:MAG TPA: PorP/SprF family type IX secretion system membrane protein [Saprospiraceae bacterium]|nr:PorP/SprF family type IX secretion system membrane protein [Saprospiraceae bacterium]HMQ84561.1 PorP/SprF family type IX secretion system membrane protein [Saprospiraceae bacterium]
MKKLALLFVICAFAQAIFAQEETIFSHYTVTPVLINPSAAGFENEHQIQLNARAAWSGFPDAPKTYAAQYNGPLGDNFGIGVGVLSESAAQMMRIRGHLNYAFRFDISKKVELAAGFSTAFQQVRLDNGATDNPLFQDGDQLIMDVMDGRSEFDASMGVYAGLGELDLNGKRPTHVGLAFTNLVKSNISGVDNANNEGSILEHYTFFVRHRAYIADYNFHIEPSVFIRNVKNSPSQVDLNVRALFLEETLSAGLSYRSLGAAGLLLGVKLTSLQVNYSYDVFFQQFQRYNQGSHEVSVLLTLPRKSETTPGKRY